MEKERELELGDKITMFTEEFNDGNMNILELSKAIKGLFKSQEEFKEYLIEDMKKYHKKEENNEKINQIHSSCGKCRIVHHVTCGVRIVVREKRYDQDRRSIFTYRSDGNNRREHDKLCTAGCRSDQ